jgi:hypothetical protein
MPQSTGMVSRNNKWEKKDGVGMDVEEPLNLWKVATQK